MKRCFEITGLILLMMFIFSHGLSAQVYRSGGVSFRLETLVEGLPHPWSLALIEPDAPQGAATEGFITIRSGNLQFISNIPQPGRGGKVTVQQVAGLPELFTGGQGGLLDVILAKDFRNTSRLYFSASKSDGGWGSGTVVYTARFDRAGLRLRNVRLIFSLEKTTSSAIHYGSRLVIGPEGDLYLSVGERGDPERAQDRRDAAGSIIRIPLNGNGLPAGDPINYSYGHRNIQGLIYHPDLNRLIAHEHGPRGGDEINLIFSDANYGWPLVSYGRNYNGTKVSDSVSLPNVTEPLVYWVPSIAPSGFALYPETGVFAPGGKGWSNQLFVGALAGKHLRRVRLPVNWQNESAWPLNGRAEEEELLSGLIGRVRDVRVDLAGYIYLLTDEPNGAFYRLIPE